MLTVQEKEPANAKQRENQSQKGEDVQPLKDEDDDAVLYLVKTI